MTASILGPCARRPSTTECRRSSTPPCTSCFCSTRTSSGSSCSSSACCCSTMVTWLPRSLKICANSTPITPPPITSTLAGNRVQPSAPSLVTTPGRSIPGNRGSTGSDPVAITKRSPRSSSPVSRNLTVRGSRNSAVPAAKRIRLRLTSVCTPCTSCATAWSFLAATAAKSTRRLVGSRPNMRQACAPRTMCAWCSRLLVGMQPRFRQVPPTSPLSTSVTAMPSRAARMAAV